MELKNRFLIVYILLVGGNLVYCDEFQCTNDAPSGYSIKLLRQKPHYQQTYAALIGAKGNGVDPEFFINNYEDKDKRTNDSVALYQYHDNEFYAQIVVGHPGQTMNVAFDTSWTISWLLSARCSTMSLACKVHNQYNHFKSTTYVKDGRPAAFPEDEGNYTGFYSYDTISIAHSNVTNQSFVEIDSVPFSYIYNKIDGIIGLGLQTDSSYKPLFYNLHEQGKIENNLFSIYLNRDKQSNHGGNIILGFVECRYVHHVMDKNNKTVYDVIKYLPVKPGGYWKFDLEKIFYTDDKNRPVIFCNSGCEAITDTSSTNIIGPKADVQVIHDIIGAKSWWINGRYSVDCNKINKLPPITFNLDGQNFTLKGTDYTVKFTYFAFTVCFSAFVPSNYNDLWVLGGAFLSKYYSIYDIENRQIGFVKSGA